MGSADRPMDRPAAGAPTLGELGEAGILREVFASLRPTDKVLVGPGDDTALLATGGAVLATTDAMVRGRDWRDDWSGPADVGAKAVVQNLADLAAMGGVGTGVLVTLIAPATLSAAWARDLSEAVAATADAEGVPVIGGDLSSSTGGVVVSITALGELPGPGPVLRSGARAGDLLAVRGSLGRSAAGLEVLQRSDTDWSPPRDRADAVAAWMGYHRRPDPDLAAGPAAARAGATAMIDVSDGLLRDAGRLASASTVRIELDEAVLTQLAAAYEPVLGERCALDCVLTGGEEHSMLATFPDDAAPDGWTVLGRVSAPGHDGPGVWWRGERSSGGGWDHFGG